MSKKKLQVEGIMNELEGASLFFSRAVTPPPATDPLPPAPAKKTEEEVPPAVSPIPSEVTKTKTDKQTVKPKGMNASKQASNTISSISDPIEPIRKIVKQAGKEVFFVRVSPEEKRALASIVYSFNELYRDEGRKTSENEIGRIALNYLLEDYRASGNNSILARVLAALNA